MLSLERKILNRIIKSPSLQDAEIENLNLDYEKIFSFVTITRSVIIGQGAWQDGKVVDSVEEDGTRVSHYHAVL